MRIESGVTTRYIYFVAVDATDFATRETGLSSFTVYRSRNGGTASAMTTPTINETDATNMPGVYELLLDEDMTIDAGDDSQEMVFHITHAGMAPVTRTIELYRSKITAGYTLGVGSDGDLLEVNTLTGHTAQTGDSFARLGAPAGASISADIADVPTVSEFNARTLAAASYFDPATDTVANVTTVATVTNGVSIADSTSDAVIADAVWNAATATYGTVGSYGEHTEALDTSNLDATISSRAAASVCTEARLAELDAANLPADVDNILVDTGTTLEGHLTDIKGGTFSGATDSLEAIRDRGDAAWTTGAGGTPPDLLQNTTIATLSTQTSFTLTAGSADDNAYNDQIAIITDSATSTQKATATISNYVGATKTITLSADPAIFTMAVGDTIDIIAATGAAGSGATAAEVWGYTSRVLTANTNLNDPTAAAIADAVWDEATTSHTTAGTFGEQAKTDIDTIITNLATAQSDLDTLTGTDGVTLATSQPNYAPNTTTPPTAAAIRAEIDSNSTQLASIQADTDDIQTRLPAALVGGKIDANMGAISSSTTAADNLEASALGIHSTTVATSASATEFTLTAGSTVDDTYIGRVVVVTSGTHAGEATNITDYVGSTKTVTVTAFTAALGIGDSIVIV